MNKIREKIKGLTGSGPVEKSSRWVGEHAGYDNTPLPRLTRAGLGMGVLVSMGGFVFGYEYFSLFFTMPSHYSSPSITALLCSFANIYGCAAMTLVKSLVSWRWSTSDVASVRDTAMVNFTSPT